MRVMVLTVLALLTGRLAAPPAAMAQYHRLTDAVAIGGTLASAGSGAQVMSGGPEVGGLVEIPIGDSLRLRGEAASGAWHFNGYPHDDIPGSRMQRHRFTVGVLRSRYPPAPARRFSTYAGGGAGVYLYRFPYRSNSGSWGIHGIVGGEYLLRTMRSRWILGGEVQLQLLNEPTSPQGTALPIASAHVAAVLKYRLP